MRKVLYGFNSSTAEKMGWGQSFFRYGVFERQQKIWWVFLATEDSNSPFDTPIPLKSITLLQYADFVVSIIDDSTFYVNKNRVLARPVLPEKFPMYIVSLEDPLYNRL